jgi:hypothetical protein
LLKISSSAGYLVPRLEEFIPCFLAPIDFLKIPAHATGYIGWRNWSFGIDSLKIRALAGGYDHHRRHIPLGIIRMILKRFTFSVLYCTVYWNIANISSNLDLY